MEVTSAEDCLNASISIHQIQSAKRKFFQWAVKWFYANMSEDFYEKPDAPILACLLQSIGFQLREFEKIENSCNTDKHELKNEVIKVTIECGTSGMRACLEMDDVKCRCPNSEDAKDASFWSVSGTGPAATVENNNKIEESGSNLLPPVTKEMKAMLNEVICHLLSMIDEKSSDANRSMRSRSNLNLTRVSSTRDMMEIVNDKSFKNDTINIVRSYTQPEIAVSDSNNSAIRRYNWATRSLVKESYSGVSEFIPKTWGGTMDVECESIDGDQPRPSPPKIASSPVVLNQLCSSLGQISLQSEEDTGNLAEHVIRAHKCLEKAVEIIINKRSPLSRSSSIHERGTFLKPPDGRLNLTGSATRKKSSSNTSLRTSPINTPNSRPGSSCSMPGGKTHSNSTMSRQSLTYLSKSPMTHRSIGTALPTLSLTPLSTVSSSKRNAQTNNVSLSKIPPRRKSFGALGGQPLKLAVAKARNVASETKKKSISPSTIPVEERVIIAAKRRVSPDPKALLDNSGIQKPLSSLSHVQPRPSTVASAVTSHTVGPIKNSAPTKESSTRKSLGNPKFGFCNKKP